jgi:hypothetical protein
MTGMANKASFLCDRLMGYGEVHTNVIVAIVAQSVPADRQQHSVFGCVGIVAGVALAILKRHMEGLIFSFIDSGVMAPGAKIWVGVRDLEGIVGVWRVVAVVAGDINGDMGTGLEQNILVGGMGAVAGRAFPVLDRVSTVGILESRLTAFVAVQAQSCGFIRQEVVLIRAVGFMADPAPIIVEYGVTDFPIILPLIVTLKTDFTALGTQEVLEIGSVRIVA